MRDEGTRTVIFDLADQCTCIVSMYEFNSHCGLRKQGSTSRVSCHDGPLLTCRLHFQSFFKSLRTTKTRSPSSATESSCMPRTPSKPCTPRPLASTIYISRPSPTCRDKINIWVGQRSGMQYLNVALRRARERINDYRQNGRKWQVCRMRCARCWLLVLKINLQRCKHQRRWIVNKG